MIDMNTPGTKIEVTIDEGGLKFTGHATEYQVETSFDGHEWSFRFGHLEVSNVRNPQVRLIEPERRGIQLEPGAKLKPGDLVDVYTVHPGGDPIIPFADTRNLTVERSEEDFNSRYVHFVDCPYRVKVESWKDYADDGYEVRMVEPAGEKVGDWSTLEDGDVVNILQYFPSSRVGRFRREVSVYDADEDGVSFDTEAGGSSAVLKEDDDVIYLVHRAKKELPAKHGSWVMVTECEVSSSVLRRIRTPFPAFKSGDWWVAEVGLGDWDYIIKPEEITDWYEIEFTKKEAA